jgi:hypothetical protein
LDLGLLGGVLGLGAGLGLAGGVVLWLPLEYTNVIFRRGEGEMHTLVIVEVTNGTDVLIRSHASSSASYGMTSEGLLAGHVEVDPLAR